MWFCERCHHRLHAEYFHLENIETQLAPVFERFFADEGLRTCKRCGTVMSRPAR
jgi:3-hydroxyanthranilate 3,4-dioxygenase